MPMEIILAEDSREDAELTLWALKKHRVMNSLLHFKNGEEVINYIITAPEGKSRLILLDLQMPRMDGFEVLRRLKSDQKTKSIPVIVLVSSNDDPEIKNCLELGADAFIVKPIEAENFEAIIKDLGMYWLLVDHTEK